MCITMLAVLTAFVCLVFGYFFFWTVRPDFIPKPTPGLGVFWPVLAAVLLLGAWALTLLARRWNRRDWATGFTALWRRGVCWHWRVARRWWPGRG
jgi:hypothetical protein